MAAFPISRSGGDRRNHINETILVRDHDATPDYTSTAGEKNFRSKSEDVVQSERAEPARLELQTIHAFINRRLHEGVRRKAARQIPGDTGTQVNERRTRVVDVGIRAMLAFFNARVDLQLRHERFIRAVAQAEVEICADARLEAIMRRQRLLHDRLAEISP